MEKPESTALRPPKVPEHDPFRVAARTVIDVNRKALESLKDK
jgi:hypothetical protein